MDHRLENEERERRADGIDRDPFPLQNDSEFLCRPDLSEKRQDNRWSRHNQDRTGQNRDHPLETQDVVCGQCGQHPGYDRSHQNQHGDPDTQSLEFGELEAHAPLEQDQPHRERYHRKQRIAEDLVGVHPPEPRSSREAEHQQEQNRRQTDAPGQPLSGNPESDHKGKLSHNFHTGSLSSIEYRTAPSSREGWHERHSVTEVMKSTTAMFAYGQSTLRRNERLAIRS